MEEPDQQTIDVFAKRSDRTVMWLAGAVAIGGALMDIGAYAISGLFMKGGGVPMIWAMWIPLCFLTIPPIHFLCRYVKKLHERIDALETQLGDRHVG